MAGKQGECKKKRRKRKWFSIRKPNRKHTPAFEGVGSPRFGPHVVMKKVPIVGLCLLAAALLSNCNLPFTEYSEVMHEGGRVVTLAYSAGYHGTTAGVGYGLSGSGDMTMTITPVSVRVPASWVTVFECDHGNRFPIKGKELFMRMEEGDTVDIEYREIYRCQMKEGPLPNDMRKECVVVDYDFIDATVTGRTSNAN